MRVLQAIPTPCAPYSVMFSNDGTRLAAGCGEWYGETGGVLLARLASDERAFTPALDVTRRGLRGGRVSVAGVYFSADDRALVAATRGSGLGPGPTLAVTVTGLALEVAAAWPALGPPPTGVMLFGDRVLVRHNAGALDQCVEVRSAAPKASIRADDGRHPLTHSRMVVQHGRVITGGGGSRGLVEWRPETGVRPAGQSGVGLVSAPLVGGAPAELVPVRACARVTAIASVPGGERFLTGGLDGEIDRWSWGDALDQERLAIDDRAPVEAIPWEAPSAGVRTAAGRLTWTTYSPRSVVGLCHLCDHERWASVDAGGQLRLWRGEATLGAWALPIPGTPRSIAAHPVEPWIAVGIKQGGFAETASTVLVLEC
ncbi:MAG: hypothetical protein R3B09_05985 [Nannocystaceae bacterium]